MDWGESPYEWKDERYWTQRASTAGNEPSRSLQRSRQCAMRGIRGEKPGLVFVCQ
jgi:hypothetical protein